MTAKTPSGFEAEICPDALENMEVLDLIAEMSGDDKTKATLAMPRLVDKLLAPEDKKRLYDHVREPSGRVPISAVMDELMALLNGSGDKAKK